MLALITVPLQSIRQLSRIDRPLNSSAIHQSLTGHHTCPCCSYVLLRHISSHGLYWRCSHCYAAMPAWQ